MSQVVLGAKSKMQIAKALIGALALLFKQRHAVVIASMGGLTVMKAIFAMAIVAIRTTVQMALGARCRICIAMVPRLGILVQETFHMPPMLSLVHSALPDRCVQRSRSNVQTVPNRLPIGPWRLLCMHTLEAWDSTS